MTEAQKCLYYIAENMRIDKSISKEGYEYFQQAIKLLGQESVLDKIRAEIGKSKTKQEMQIAEKDIKAKLLISDIYCDIVNILDKYKAESEEKDENID